MRRSEQDFIIRNPAVSQPNNLPTSSVLVSSFPRCPSSQVMDQSTYALEFYLNIGRSLAFYFAQTQVNTVQTDLEMLRGAWGNLDPFELWIEDCYNLYCRDVSAGSIDVEVRKLVSGTQ